ncbi:MAG: hypothetical protein ACXWO3_18860, partial [Isosphaeraceae bacterium]
MARLLSCTLVLGFAALLGLPSSASAGTILIFGQSSPSDFVSAAFSGDSATLTTHGVSNTASPTSIPITVTQVGNVTFPGGTGLPAFETFVPSLTSSTPQVGDEKGGFSREIIISSLPGGLGLNILTSVFSGGILNATGNSGGLRVPGGVTFTTAEADIITALGGATTATGNLSLSFTNVQPFQSGGFNDFTAQNSGLFATAAVSAIIPEPASMVMALWAV